MQFVLFNGSPRGKKSNTALLLEHFRQGYLQGGGAVDEPVYLVQTGNVQEHAKIFSEAKRIVLAFPLYTDAMPGVVKNFIEALMPFCGKMNGVEIGYIVQSGFPETHHSRYVERYLEKLTRRLGAVYLGTIVKGGVEGIRIKPPWMTKKLFSRFYALGLHLAEQNEFDKTIIEKLSKPEKLSPFVRSFYRFLNLFGITNMYWDMQLKNNKAFENRFAQPFRGKL